MFGGDAGSGVIGVSGDVGGDALELHGEHSEVEDLDEGEFSLVLSKLNLDLFCFEWRVDGTLVTLFCVKRVLSVVVSVRENLWNLLPHLHGAKISELSFIIIFLLVLIRCRISIRSVIQILHCAVREDFMHWMRSPCHIIVGVMILFILALT